MRPDEDVGMAHLSRLCFGERADKIEFIRSRYTHNTGAAAHVMIAEASGEIVATQAVTLLPFYLGGQPCVGGMYTAGMTHPGHRKRGIFREVVDACREFAFESGCAFLFTMPNDESFPAFQKMPDWICLPDRRLRAFPLNVGRVLRDRGVPRPFAAIAGRIADAFFQSRWIRVPSAVREVATFAEFAAELDRLADERGRRCGGVQCKREARFLRWRFDENPTFRYRRFVAIGATGLEGYLVTTDEHRMGTRLTHVVDWLAADRPDVLEGLLAAAANAARESGSGLLTLIAADGVEIERFAAFGFRGVPTRLAGRAFHTAICPNPARPELRVRLADPSAWYLTLGDFDTI